MRHFLLFFILLLPGLLPSQTEEESRCRYRPSREFLLSRNDSCYRITSAEADRAFGLRCWDEAMALYRAAKSCTDANQTARSLMNRRIQACRDSAEQELRRSEQQARRQFLHAAAANLADDAEERLKAYDRSFAYRLAEFAGEYIAPGPNPDCINTLLEAWYYVPPLQPGTAGYQDLQVPFCYQLDYDLGSNVQVRFGGKGKYLRLYAYAPASRQLLSWDAGTMKPGKGMVVEEGLSHFDISPDGWTLMFFSEKNILFWRSSSEVFRLAASKIGRYCFSPSGDEFLYYDEKEGKIYSLNMRDIFAQRKGGQRPGAQTLLQNVPYDVLGMAYYKGRIWLGGRDSMIVLQKGEPENLWSPRKIIPWNQRFAITEAADLKIWPDHEAAFFIQYDNPGGGAGRRADSLNSVVRIPLVMQDDLPVSAGEGTWLRGTPLAVKYDASLAAFSDSERDLMYLLTTDAGAMRHGAFLQPDDRFNPVSGSFSADGRWFAAATDTGTLKLWALTELSNDSAISLAGDVRPVFSEDQNYLCRYDNGALQVCTTEQPEQPLFSITDIPENTILCATGKNRVAYYSGGNNLRVKSGSSAKTWDLPVDDGTEPMAAFNENENLIAYTVRADSLVIRSLENDAIVAGRTINGSIGMLKFIPRSENILVVQNDPTQSYLENQIIAKVWNYNSKEPAQTIRLHGYGIYLAALASNGDQVAFTDGKDIRVFHLDNLLDESARIRPNEQQFVTAIAFHPDGSALAAGYNDGMVIVWDLATGEPRFRLQTKNAWIEQLGFSPDGGRLRIKNMDGYLFFRNIDPAVIRATAQTAYLRLLAFTPDQIQSKGLEKALDYSGNFQRLAESGDLPLIRSFFEYYRQQALSSNNINQVRNYFSSASRLYSKLDDPVTQRALRPTMHEIYEDYIWKLLLREKNDEAARIVGDFYRLFDKPLPAFKSGAFASLLRNDFAGAARQYAEWTIRMYENPVVQPYFWSVLDSIQQKFHQLNEYNLLSGQQRNCICNIYSKILDIKDLNCQSSGPEAVPFDTETRLRWNIFQNTYLSSGVYNHAEKARMLETAFGDAKTLYRRNAGIWRNQLEKTTLELARAYTERGVFEQGNALSAALYEEALRLLDTFGRFKSDEPARQKALINNHLKLGDYFLSINRLADAARQFEAGLSTADQLLQAAPADSLPAYRNDLLAPLYTELGFVQLFQGKTGDAGASFRQAYDAYTYGLYAYFFGYVYLLEGNETEARRQFGEIYSAQQLGDVLFIISRLADLFPEQRDRLDAFIPDLRKSVLDAHPDISPDDADYRFAVQKSGNARNNGQWTEALAWNEKSLVIAERLANQPEASDQLKSQLLDAMLSESFYLLFTGKTDPRAYDKAIATVEKAETYVEKGNFYYQYRDWLLTNLAHAYLLRNGLGDREKAVEHYRTFVGMVTYGQDHWELLQKDFRDLHQAGIQWPNLKEVVMAIKPANTELTAEDWKDMGVEMPGEGGK